MNVPFLKFLPLSVMGIWEMAAAKHSSFFWRSPLQVSVF
jgi:hypothetical protein